MEANVWSVGKLFNNGGDVHFVLPRFQRPYAWERTEWQALWDDLLEVHEAGMQSRHFLGAVVVVEEDIRGLVPTFTLIDGQQRLLTLSLLLHALAREAKDEKMRAKIGEFLTNRYEEGSLRYKVLPTDHYGDREAWMALVADRPPKDNSTSRVLEAHRFFCRAISQGAARRNIEARELFNTLVSRLQVVFINLKREERPHQIFESLNARGRALEQADLVRNYLAMRLPASEQDSAYQRYWLPVQDMFEEQRSAGISDFLLNYLACKSGAFYREDQTYRQFRKRMDTEFSGREDLVAELATMHRHAGYFARFLKPDGETDPKLRPRLDRFNALERTVVRPLLLHLFDARHGGKLTHEELLEALDLLDNYLTRHFLASLHTGGLRRFLASLVRVDSLSELRQRLHGRNYPGDERLRHVLQESDLYSSAANRRRLVYILTRVTVDLQPDDDTFLRLKGAPTIEHIMPRSLNKDWERHIRRKWDDADEVPFYLNLLGNLTLVTQSWNSTMSNNAWHEKRGMLRKHGLPLNQQYFGEGRQGDTDAWNERAIDARGNWIIDALLNLWPDLRETKPPESSYNPDRHPNPVFDYTGRKAVSLTVRGTTWDVPGHGWNRLIALFTNKVAASRSDFAEIAAQLPDELANQQGHEWDQELENGWWLCYMHANRATWYLRELAGHCDLPDEDWHITLNQ